MKKFRLTALLLALVMMLSACGPKQETPSNQGNSQQPGNQGSEPTKEVTYQSTITIGCDGVITEVNPYTQSNWTHNYVFRMVFDRLVEMDPETFEITPSLAKSWNWTSDTVLEMDLRDDVIFHDGTKMTSADIIASAEFMAEQATNKSTWGRIEKIEALGDYKIRMTLAEPYIDWLMLLAQLTSCITSKAALEKDPTGGAQVGSGPYKVESHIPSDTTVLVRNDQYWGEMPKTEKFVFRYMAEDSARLIALQTGEIDVCCKPATIELDIVKGDANLRLDTIASSSMVYFAFNSSNGPGTDQNLRLAVAHALDLDEIINVAVNGYGQKSATHWCKSTFGYNDKIEAYKYDPELAKEYLAKASTNKFTITTTGNERETVAQVIQEQLRKVGITVDVEIVEGSEFSSKTGWKRAEHETCIYNFGWLPYGSDVSRPYGNGSGTNKAIVKNERIFELVDLGGAEQDSAKRAAYYAEIQEINHEQAYYIPLYFADQFVAVKDGMEGTVYWSNRAYDFRYTCLPNK